MLRMVGILFTEIPCPERPVPNVDSGSISSAFLYKKNKFLPIKPIEAELINLIGKLLFIIKIIVNNLQGICQIILYRVFYYYIWKICSTLLGGMSYIPLDYN